MSKFKHDLLLRLIKLVDAVLMTIPFALCWYLYYSDRTASPFDQKGNLIVVLLFLVLFIIFGRIYDAFMMSIQQISEIVYAQFLAVAVSDLIMYVVICLLSKGLTNLFPGIAALVGQIILAFLWAYLAHHGYYATFPAKRTAIICDDSAFCAQSVVLQRVLCAHYGIWAFHSQTAESSGDGRSTCRDLCTTRRGGAVYAGA